MARQRRTSKELAEVLHCSQSSASRRMTGETVLDLDEIDAIVKWLGVDLEDLVAA